MASNPLGGDQATVTRPERFPPAAAARLAGKLLNRHSPHEIAEAVQVLIDVLDLIDGNPDSEDATDLEDDFAISPVALSFTAGPGCEIADQDAGAYVEWHSKPANLRRHGQPEFLVGHEDAEQDDAPEDDDPAEDGDCDIAVDDLPCDEPYQDLEREQMTDDVPMPRVWTAEHNIFNDKRTDLGRTNLMTTFVSGGPEASADTGETLLPSRRIDWGSKPGLPV